MRLSSTLAFCLLASSLSGQQIIDTFSYGNGAVPPIWIQQQGTFKIANKQLVSTGGRVWHYMTHRAIPKIADCVLDIDVIYPTANGLYFGGMVARHQGGPGENGHVMLKLQDNNSAGSGSFDTLWLYERPGGATLTRPPRTKAATIRLLIKDKQAWAEHDGNMDGIFEVKSAVRALNHATQKPSGLVGVSAYGTNTIMDNWKFYDAVLQVDPAKTSTKIGTTHGVNLRINHKATPVPTPWLGMASLGNAGIPLGDGRAIPLSFDILWVASFGLGWSGVILPNVKDAKFAVPIPNNTALVGANIFLAAITLQAGRHLSVGAISNDHHFQITR